MTWNNVLGGNSFKIRKKLKHSKILQTLKCPTGLVIVLKHSFKGTEPFINQSSVFYLCSTKSDKGKLLLDRALSNLFSSSVCEKVDAFCR